MATKEHLVDIGLRFGNGIVSTGSIIGDLMRLDSDNIIRSDFEFDVPSLHYNSNLGSAAYADIDAFIQEETDPVFSAWDKSTGISITEDQISDLQDYALSTHNHNSIYAAIDHNHDAEYAAIDHLHDDRYFTESELATAGAASVNWANLVGTPPAMVVIDTYVVNSGAEQLALTVQQGDVCVRLDEHKNYINLEGNNSSMSDWQELEMPDAPTLGTITGTLAVTKGGTGKNTITTDTFLYGSEMGVYSEALLTSFARSILDDADAETVRQTLELSDVYVEIANQDDITRLLGSAAYADIDAFIPGVDSLSIWESTNVYIESPKSIHLDSDYQIAISSEQLLSLKSTSSHVAIYTQNNRLALEANQDGKVYLTFAGDKVMKTISGGISVNDGLELTQISGYGYINHPSTTFFLRQNGDNKIGIKTDEIQFYEETRRADSVCSYFGTGKDMNLHHSGSHGYIENSTGNLYVNIGGSVLRFESDKVYSYKDIDLISGKAYKLAGSPLLKSTINSTSPSTVYGATEKAITDYLAADLSDYLKKNANATISAEFTFNDSSSKLIWDYWYISGNGTITFSESDSGLSIYDTSSSEIFKFHEYGTFKAQGTIMSMNRFKCGGNDGIGTSTSVSTKTINEVNSAGTQYRQITITITGGIITGWSEGSWQNFSSPG